MSMIWLLLKSAFRGAMALGYCPGFANLPVAESCRQLHLDSGIQREETHRFYEREGISRAGFHFADDFSSNKALQPRKAAMRPSSAGALAVRFRDA